MNTQSQIESLSARADDLFSVWLVESEKYGKMAAQPTYEKYVHAMEAYTTAVGVADEAAGATPAKAMTWADFGKQAREHGSMLLAKYRRQYRRDHTTRKCVLVPREAEVIAYSDAKGRLSNEPMYLNASQIRGKGLRLWIESEKADLLAHGHTDIRFSICFGYDLYDSLQDRMQGNDYTPMVEMEDLNVPQELVDSRA